MAIILFITLYVLFFLSLVIGVGIILPFFILRAVWRGLKVFLKDFFAPLDNKDLPDVK